MNASKPYIRCIAYLSERRPKMRKLKLLLSNKTMITAAACYESWQQWGGTKEELQITQDTVVRHNDWLHGGQRP